MNTASERPLQLPNPEELVINIEPLTITPFEDHCTFFKDMKSKRFKDFTLIEVRILTGRTHQIRVHTSYLGHPVVGDKTYGRKRSPFNLKGQLLHAETLGFRHPRTEKYLEFKAPLPETMRKVIKALTVE